MKILFLGCGKMGSILKDQLLGQVEVLNSSQKKLPKNYQADLVFLAIKPQGSEEILRDFAAQKPFHSKTIFISILAGKRISFFEKIFGAKAKIIRSMPNLPIQEQQGLFPYLCNKNISVAEEKKLGKIFARFGVAFRLRKEYLFDVATAIFGSGPAYIFLLQEILADIAKHYGIKDVQFVKQLFLGSAVMSCNSNLSLEKLRESVTSKGGTTAAALTVLQKKSALKKLFSDAIATASARSKTLSNE
ncbi:MAG: hypothetical protein FJX34_01185 [Alphaproteobacteria bacterium]|nr:hypothetical protein [Alphaproteobacteria bacterium]